MKRWWLRFKAWAWTALAFALILTAVVVGTGRLLFPFVERYQPEIEAWLSEKTGRSITVRELSGRWNPAGPALRLSDLVIDERLTLPQAELQLDLYAWARRGDQPWTVLILNAEHVSIIRDAEGAFQVEGLGGGSSARSTALEDLPLGLFDIQADLLTFRDDTENTAFELPDAEGRLHIRPDDISLGINVAGELGGVRIVAEIQRAGASLKDASLYIRTEDLSLSSLGDYFRARSLPALGGRLNAQIWTEWRDRRLAVAEGTAEVSWLASKGEVADTLSVDGAYRSEGGDRWSLVVPTLAANVGELAWAASVELNYNVESGLAGSVDQAPLEMILPLANRLGFGESLEDSLIQKLSPFGNVRNIVVSTPWPASIETLMLDAEFVDAGIVSVGPIPGFSGVNGHANHRGSAGALDFRTDGGEFSWPANLAEPIGLGQTVADVSWLKEDGAWSLAVVNGLVERSDFQASGHVKLKFDGARPSINAAVDVGGGELRAALQAVPIRGVPPAVRAWMVEALRAGVITDGGLVVHGDLDDWPFNKNEGLFEVSTSFTDARVNYWPRWPQMRDAVGNVRLRNDRLDVSVSEAYLQDLKLSGGDAVIESIGASPLVIRSSTSADARELIKTIRTTPLRSTFEPWVDRLDLVGKAQSEATITIPFGAGESLTVQGRSDLNNVDVALSDPKLSFQNARGILQFSESGFQADSMSVEFRDRPGELSLEVGSATDDPERLLLARLAAPVAIGPLLTDMAIDVPWRDRLVGESDWTFVLEVPTRDNPTTLLALSDLEGTAFNLPEPVTKAASTRRALTARATLGTEPSDVQLQLEGVGALRLRSATDTSPQIGWIGLGDARRTVELPNEGWRVRGDASVADIGRWLDLINALPDVADSAGLETLQLDAQAVKIFGRTFPAMRLLTERDGTNWQVAVDGNEIRGKLRLPELMNADGTIDAQFDRLILPEADDEDGEGMAFDAADLPVIHLYAKSAKLLGAEVGTLRLETYPTVDGMRVGELESTSENLRIRASGDWTQSMTGGRSDFEINLSAEDLGAMLRNFGFEGMVEGGQSVLDIDATWNGLPTQFEMNKLSGKLKLSVGGGQFLDVEPGAGRFFGLLSLQSVPRRLILDFSDVFKSGLTFDTILGTFDLDAGQAYTEDLRVTAPAADIYVTGRTGLAGRDYDQTVVVIPNVGQTLPILGALAGLGPAGAAALLLAQGVFSQQIDQMTQVRYQVTGSWDDPTIERLAAPATAKREEAKELNRG